MTIAVDFDGTIVNHRYPHIGKERPFAIATLKQLQRDGHYLILWTVRDGNLLEEAIEYCRSKGLIFHAVNSNLGEDESSHTHRKISADLFIDDRNLGGLPEWGEIYRMITDGLGWEDISDRSLPVKKSFIHRLFCRND
ncbi:MAG: hypothetical protein NC453_23980 [Muribaculum sp.]|nr:hypothetical protein [Muribaculum sp.]